MHQILWIANATPPLINAYNIFIYLCIRTCISIDRQELFSTHVNTYPLHAHVSTSTSTLHSIPTYVSLMTLTLTFMLEPSPVLTLSFSGEDGEENLIRALADSSPRALPRAFLPPPWLAGNDDDDDGDIHDTRLSAISSPLLFSLPCSSSPDDFVTTMNQLSFCGFGNRGA